MHRRACPKGGRPPFPVETLLRIHFLQQWFNLSDPAMEEALYDTPMFREFAGLDIGEDNLPDESTILRLRHWLEEHQLAQQILATVDATLAAKGLLLKQGTVVDATWIAAPSSTKNKDRQRDPEMVSGDESQPRTTKKGNPWYFVRCAHPAARDRRCNRRPAAAARPGGMKAHIGVDADSGLDVTLEQPEISPSDTSADNSRFSGGCADLS